MDVNWLMSNREAVLWADRVAAEDWTWPIWKSVFFSSGLIALWLVFVCLAIIGLIPHLRRSWAALTGFTVAPIQGLGLFLCSAFIFSLTHAVIFSTGVIAFWLNTALPADLLETLSEFSYKWLSVIGWLVR